MPLSNNTPSTSVDPVVNGLRDAFFSLYELGIRQRQTYSEILLQTLLVTPGLVSTWTVWEPNALDGNDDNFRDTPGHDETGRFVHCWHRAHGKQQLVPVVGYKTPSEGNWYWLPKRRLASCRLDPIDYRFGSHSLCIRSEITPLIHEGRFCGAVGVDWKVSPKEVRPRLSRTNSDSYQSTTSLCESKLDALSPREHEVFHWLELGKTNEEIGIVLGISHHTVKNHLDRIFQKLGVHNRYEAIQSIR
jgi:DNA-binding CsgD family transcriptional regulator